jgi:Tol biopolymer transport system component
MLTVLLSAGGSWRPQNYAQGVTEAERLLQKAMLSEDVDGNLQAAVEQYKKIVSDNGGNRAVAARALLRLAGCYEKLGREEAKKTYQQLINDYPDQAAEVASARQKLAGLTRVLEKQASKPVFRKITIPGKISARAQLSPDGARLAMVSDGDVWVVNLQGKVATDIAGAPVQLTRGASASWAGLTWSGNGQWIAFNEERIPSRDIYVLPASGGALQKLSRDVPIWGGSPRWLGLSSDGSRLIYSTESEDRVVLQMVSVDTGEMLARFGSPDALEPAFSPDGRHVAYVSRLMRSDMRGKVRIVRLADGDDVPINEGPILVRTPTWSPNGSMLAYLTHPHEDDVNMEELWITPLGESGEAVGKSTKIPLPRLAQSIAGWTADNKIGLLCPSPFRSAIYTVPLTGGKATQVTPDTWDSFLPQWSPDGERIYFRWGKGDIAFVPAGGGPIGVVSPEKDKLIETLPGGGNHISPDGSRIVFSAYEQGKPGLEVHLWTMPAAGGEPVRLPMKPDLTAWQPRWSPDGKWIAFESERDVPGERKLDENIFIVSSEGGEPRQLTHHTDCFCELEAWSPGGDLIAYACSDKAIRIIPVAGGEPRAVLKADGLENHQGSLAWTLDGSRLMYAAKGRLWTVSTSGGEPAAIKTDMDGNILQFALSPDGKTIAFNIPSGGDAELWLMEGFLSLVK